MNKITDNLSNISSTTNRVTQSVQSAKNGVENIGNVYNGAKQRAGEIFNETTSSASGIVDKIGNLFGGSDQVSDNPIKTVGSGQSGSSPGHRLAGFSNNPAETLPSLDPLKREVSDPFKDSNPTANSALSYLGKTGAGSLFSKGWTSLKSTASTLTDGVASTYDSVRKRLESTMNVVGQVQRLSQETRNQISNYISAYQSTKYQVSAMVDGAKHTFNSLKDYDNYLNLSSFSSSYLKNNANPLQTMDIGTASGLIYGLASQLNTYNLPSKSVELVETIGDDTTKVALYGELMVQAAKTGSVSSVAFYCTKLTPEQRMVYADDTIKALLTNLRLGANDTEKTIGASLLSTLTEINPLWDTSTGTGATVELLYYTYCNSVAIRCLLTTPKYRYVCAAGNRGYQPVANIIDAFFPV